MLPSLAALGFPTDAATKRGRDPPYAERVELPDADAVRALQSLDPFPIFGASENGIFVYRLEYDDFNDLFFLPEFNHSRLWSHVYADPRLRVCGSFNCYVNQIKIVGEENMGKFADAYKTAIMNLFPRRIVPQYVAFRFPKGPPLQDVTEGREKQLQNEAWGELALTLQMSKLGIAMPILAAIPLRPDVVSMDSFRSFCYVTESGWMSLATFLQVTENFDEEDLQKELVALINLCADSDVLLFDIKPPNIVVKPKDDYSGRYYIRMIDFDDQFATIANRHSKYTGYTTSDCVFVLNALLLLNYAIKYVVDEDAAAVRVFRPLALEMKSRWKNVTSRGFDAFCAYLDEDKTFAQNLEVLNEKARIVDYDLDLYNLTEAKEDDFFMLMRITFYYVLENYAESEFYEEMRYKVKQPVSARGYLSYIVNAVYEQF
jgi:hypothetical protein